MNGNGTELEQAGLTHRTSVALQSKYKAPSQNRGCPYHSSHLSINTDILCWSQMCPSERIDSGLCDATDLPL